MFTTSGIFHYDPLPGTKHYEPWWGLARCDSQLSDYYAWLLERHGIEVETTNLWGTHVSVLKGEAPLRPEHWGKYEGFEVELHYNHLVRYDNGKHAWVDVYSDDLSEIRQELGFVAKPWYHLTVGRLIRPYTIDFTKYGVT
jgi:hypothetical protein